MKRYCPARDCILYFIIFSICIIHVHQVILRSGFERIPGDLADSRFNNLILEHLWNVSQGKGALSTPPMFHPVGNTLYLSDNHIGTFPFYAIFRLIGWTSESALQGWVLTLAALNIAALIFAFHRWRLPIFMTGCLVFYGSSHFAFIGNSGHLQLFSVFPSILLCYFLVEYFKTQKNPHLIRALLLLAYQHLCSPYYGYFITLIITLFLIIFLAIGHRSENCKKILEAVRKDAVVLGGITIVVIGVLFLYYWPYYKITEIVGSRSPDELQVFSPTIEAWLTAAGNSVWYRTFQCLSSGAHGIELNLFTGFGSWALYIIVLALSWRRRATSMPALVALALICTLIILAVILTRWPFTKASLYMMVAEHVSGIRAFRAMGRFIYLGLPISAMAFAIIFKDCENRLAPGWINKTLAIASVVLAVESLSRPTFSYSKAEAQDRTRAVIESFREVGLRQVLAFAPGASNEPAWMANIDAMSAAWTLALPAINGYSGHIPKSHVSFFSTLTPQALAELARDQNIQEEALTIASHYPSWFVEKYNITGFELARPFFDLQPAGNGNKFSGRINERLLHAVKITNTMSLPVPCARLNLHLSYKMYDSEGLEVLFPASPRTFIQEISAASSQFENLVIALPPKAGIYRIRVSMVHEGVAWWCDINKHGYDIFVTVVN